MARAVRVAPGKVGQAFDRAWGVILDIYPGEEVSCVIRATNLDLFYTEVVNTESTEGDTVRWRLSAQYFGGLIAKIPMGQGKTIKMVQDGRKITITSGRTKAVMALGDNAGYPEWEMFDETSVTVQNLGSKLNLVDWATSNQNNPPWSGVHLDGKHAIATDRYKLVRVPCEFQLDHPVTIPAGTLRGVLRAQGETGIRAVNGMLLLQPDPYTQVQVTTYDSKYPPVQKIMNKVYQHKVELHRDTAIALIDRATQMAGSNRMPTVKIFLGREEMAAFMANDEVGTIGDVYEVPGFAAHPRVEIKFTPQYLMDAMAKCPSDMLDFWYDPNNAMEVVKITDNKGYDAWVVPRKDIAE
jgi:DNA polymerase III sliding clamp (beta) subunit (PCNA family)